MNKKIFLLFSLLFSAAYAFSADGNGKIIDLIMASKKFSAHPDVAQFTIEGGFSNSSCNEHFAAVRKEDEHLVSLLLAAKLAEKPIEVFLNSADIYYDVAGNSPRRCIAYLIHMK